MADDAAVVSSQGREIDRLNDRISKLGAENARRKQTVQQLCQALGVNSNADLANVVNELRSAGGYAKLKGQLDELRTKSNPDELQKRYDQAVGELRTLKHRDGLKGLYQDRDLGLNADVPVERLEAILGYKAEGDAFDAGRVKQQIQELKQKGSDPYLFGQSTSAAGQSSTAQTQAPAWGGRGASGQPDAGAFSDAQLRDPGFMFAAHEQAQRQFAAK